MAHSAPRRSPTGSAGPVYSDEAVSGPVIFGIVVFDDLQNRQAAETVITFGVGGFGRCLRRRAGMGGLAGDTVAVLRRHPAGGARGQQGLPRSCRPASAWTGGPTSLEPSPADLPTSPPGLPPLVSLTPWHGDTWAVVVQAGSSSAALTTVVESLPAGLRFVESFGDVDTVLVYEPEPTANDRTASPVPSAAPSEAVATAVVPG